MRNMGGIPRGGPDMYVCLGAVSLSLLRYRLFIKPQFDIQTGEKRDRKRRG